VQQRADLVGLHGLPWQEHQPGAVLAGRRQRQALTRAHATQELVRHLHEYAGAVAGVGLAAAGAAVQKVDENLERLAHDGVRPAPLDVDHETDATRVALVVGVVQALGGGLACVQRLRHSCVLVHRLASPAASACTAFAVVLVFCRVAR
jgi:hypothetical protein